MNKISESILESLEYSTDAKKWIQGKGEEFIRKVGIVEGYTVLDFGCRIGHYVIPTANIVGPTGHVYALDKDNYSLDIMMKNAKILGLENRITPINTTGELTINLDNNSIDIVLLYDVIHIILGINGTINPLQILLLELSRILKDRGILSISITHLDDAHHSKQDIIKEIKKLFTFQNAIREEMMHWDWLRTGQVENFTLQKL